MLAKNINKSDCSPAYTDGKTYTQSPSHRQPLFQSAFDFFFSLITRSAISKTKTQKKKKKKTRSRFLSGAITSEQIHIENSTRKFVHIPCFLSKSGEGRGCRAGGRGTRWWCGGVNVATDRQPFQQPRLLRHINYKNALPKKTK